MSTATLVTPADFSPFPWMKFAFQELGTLEFYGQVRHNPRIVGYHSTCGVRTKKGVVIAQDDETAWCSAFANWCMNQAGILGTQMPNARSWLNWGQSLPLPAPVYGCITVLKRGKTSWQGHVGFFVGDSPGGRVCLLGGNQSTRAGGAVCLKEYPRNDLLGYRWPWGQPKPA